MQAGKTVGLDMIQVSKLPGRYYTPEGLREFARLLREKASYGSVRLFCPREMTAFLDLRLAANCSCRARRDCFLTAQSKSRI